MSHNAIPRKPVGSSHRPCLAPSDAVSELSVSSTECNDYVNNSDDGAYDLERTNSLRPPSADQEHYVPCHRDINVDAQTTNSPDEDTQPLQRTSAKAAYPSSIREGRQCGLSRLLHHAQAWWQEISCCFFAVLLFAGLIVLLKHYNKRENPEWAAGLTINTVVAIIATMCRALTVIPISEGLSQLKWNAFSRNGRPVSDLYAFDQASRGPLGSFLLLFKIRGRLLGVGTLAAAVLLSGLATSPLTQASISLAPPPVLQVQSAKVRRCINPSPEVGGSPALTSVERAAYEVLMSGSSTRESYHYRQVEPVCPVGDCRWDPFNSLAVCAAMRNTTGNLKIQKVDDDTAEAMFGQLNTDDVFNLTLGSHPYRFSVLDEAVAYRTLVAVDTSGAVIGDDEISENYESATLSTADFIYKVFFPPNPDRNFTYGAVRASWHWCVHRYEVNVEEGVPNTQLRKKSFSIQEDDGSLVVMDADHTEAFKPSYGSFALSGLDGNFSVKNPFLDNVANILGEENPHAYHYDPSERLGKLAEDVAFGVTAHFRSAENSSDGVVMGYAGIGGDIIVVRWGRLSLLGSQIVLTMFFLAYVAVHTARAGVEIVKSSNIAELVAIDEGRKHSVDGSVTEKAAVHVGGIAAQVDESLHGILVKEEDRWYLDVSRPESSAVARSSGLP